MFAQKGPASQGGQILLVVILVIIVTSTIGLSIASRSITSLRTSTEEAESQKALSAAEAGIERAIQGSVPIKVGDNLSNNSTYSTEIEGIKDKDNFIINGGSTILDKDGKIIGKIPNLIPKDEGADVWFVGRKGDNTPDYDSVLSPKNLALYWGLPSEDCNTPNKPAAIEAVVISRDKNSGKIKSYRYAYDPCTNKPGDRGNNFTEPEVAGNDTIDKVTFKYRTKKNDLAQGVKDIVLVRVIPIYKDTAIGVDTCDPSDRNNQDDCTKLHSQGYVISSTGTSGEVKQKLTVFKGYPQTYLPYLSYGLFVAN